MSSSRKPDARPDQQRTLVAIRHGCLKKPDGSRGKRSQAIQMVTRVVIQSSRNRQRSTCSCTVLQDRSWLLESASAPVCFYLAEVPPFDNSLLSCCWAWLG